MKVALICPFNIDQLTGTPIRTKITASAICNFAHVALFAQTGLFEGRKSIDVYSGNRDGIIRFTYKVVKGLVTYCPDVLHGVSTLSIIPMVLYKIYRPSVKLVFEIHGWSWYETKYTVSFYKRIIFLLLDSLAFIVSDTIISMSLTQKKFLQETIYNKKNINVVWGPVDFEINKEAISPREIFKIGYIGNDSFWQGVDSIIECAALLEQRKDIVFELAGFEIKNLSKYQSKKNIVYVGKVARNDVKSFICDKDLMISPRIKSDVSNLQYPQKISEYLACGRPVVVSDVNDQSSIIMSADCGIVLHEVNAHSLCVAIEKIINLSSKEREMMGMRAADFAQKEFSFDVFTSKIKSVYTSI